MNIYIQEVVPVAAGPNGQSGIQIDRWPDSSWRRLLLAVADPSRVWGAMPKCPVCGLYLAAPDCEPDAGMCWSRVAGSCHRPG